MFIELYSGEIVNLDLVEGIIPKSKSMYDLNNRALDVNWILYIGGTEVPLLDGEYKRILQILSPLKLNVYN